MEGKNISGVNISNWPVNKILILFTVATIWLTEGSTEGYVLEGVTTNLPPFAVLTVKGNIHLKMMPYLSVKA